MDIIEVIEEFQFQELEFSETHKAGHASKKDKRDIKDQAYLDSKLEKRIKYTAQKKAKKLLIHAQFQSLEEKEAYFKMKQDERRALRQNALDAMNSPLIVVIDCAFEELMADRETRSLARQISELYSENRHRKHPCAIKLAGVYPRLKVFLDELGFTNWSIQWSTEQFYEDKAIAADPIYLTPDAEEELKEVCGNETFIVGGLVDRLIVKNATLNRSRGIGIRAMRLPISHMIKKSFKKALNVSTAALMIPEYLNERDWEKTFNAVVPKKFSEKDANKDTQKDYNFVKSLSSEEDISFDQLFG